MIHSRRTLAALSGTILLTLSLAACTGSPAPTRTSSAPRPTVAPVALPTPSPDPTSASPTPAHAPSPAAQPVVVTKPTTPQPTLPLSCADILTAAQASELLRFPLKLQVDERSFQYGASSIAARQAGELSCVWGGGAREDRGWDTAIALDVLPNAAAAYRDVSTQNEIAYRAGSASQYLCGQESCSVDLLSHGYWAHARVGFLDPSQAPKSPSAASRAEQFLDLLDARIAAAASPRPSWNPAASAISGRFCSDAAAASASVSKAFHVRAPKMQRQSSDLGDPFLVATTRGHDVSCSWFSAGIDVSVVKGAAWAFSSLPDAMVPNFMDPRFAPIAIPGYPTAVGGCNGADGCIAYVKAGGSLVSVVGPPTGFAAAASRLVGDIVAAG